MGATLEAEPTTQPADPFVGDAKLLVAKDATVQKLAGGMKFTEGPAWLNRDGGFLILSDQPNNALNRWDPAGGLKTYRQPSNVSNGNFALPGGAFLCCEQAIRSVTRHEADGKTITVLVDRHSDRKKFHSPNDVVQKSDGTIWFTDPPYGLPKGQTKEYAGQWVFCFDPKTKTVKPVAQDFDMPNGLCFSPDESKLYIADSGKPHHVRVFDVQPDNTLQGGSVFCVIDKGVPDGMRCDTNGRLWSTAGDGIQIFSTEGKLIGRILTPETAANCCWGGPRGTTLFITAVKSLYAVETVETSGEKK